MLFRKKVFTVKNMLRLRKGFFWQMVACLFIAFVVFGCASTKIYPKGNVGAIESENRVTITQNNVTLTVLTNTWNRSPYDVVDYYTPMEVVIRNDQEHSIDIDNSDFLLFDDMRNQYRAVNPNAVDQVLGYDPYGMGYGRLYASFGAGRSRFMRPFFHDPFFYPYWYYNPYYFPYYYTSDVQKVGLLPGEVRPHAQVRGFLYFQKISPLSKDLTMEWVVNDPISVTPTIITVKLGVARSGGIGGGSRY